MDWTDEDILAFIRQYFADQLANPFGPPPERASPYVDPLTGNLDYYNQLLADNAAIDNTTPADNIGGPGMDTINGEMLFPQMLGRPDQGGWAMVPPTPSLIANQDNLTGGSNFGGVAPGDIPYDVQSQLIAGQFTQYPVGQVGPRTTPYHAAMPVLADAYAQSQLNPNRSIVNIPTALTSDPYFDEYAQAFAPYRRPINVPVPGVQGLFGAPSPAQVMIQNYTPPGRKPLVAEARNARPREYVPAPAPAPQPYVEYAPSEPLRQMVQQFIAAPAARNTATARNTR